MGYWIKATIDIGSIVEISPAFMMSILKTHAQTIVACDVFSSSRQSAFLFKYFSTAISLVCKKVANCIAELGHACDVVRVRKYFIMMANRTQSNVDKKRRNSNETTILTRVHFDK